jgi:DNA-binding beta-propeller fold protein YncE
MIRKIVVATGAASTLAGTGSGGGSDGIGTVATFLGPRGIAVNPSNGNIYVTEALGNRIRIVTPAGVVSTLAGSGTASSIDGVGIAASFNNPNGIAVIPGSGNIVVVDTDGQCIRTVTPAGVVSTLAGSNATSGYTDGQGTAARFSSPVGCAVIPSTGAVVVTDSANYRIRVVTPSGYVSTLAGSSTFGYVNTSPPGTSAQFKCPYGICLNPYAEYLYVSDYTDQRIRRITMAYP